MKSDLIKLGLIGLIAVLLQLLIFRHLSYQAIEPDIVLLVLMWVIITQNRTKALLFAATTGLLTDFFLDLWGLNLLAKTLTTFIVYPLLIQFKESRLIFTQVFLLLFVISLLHNLFFLLSAYFTRVYHAELVFFQILVGSSLLTAIIGSIIYLLREN